MALFVPLFSAKRCLQVAIEAVYGTAESLVDADAGFRCDDPTLTFSEATAVRESIDASGSYAPGTPIAMTASGSCGVRFYGAAAAVPVWARLLQISRYTPGVGGSSNVFTLENDSSAWKSATVKNWMGGIRFRTARGVMADLQMTWTAGKNLVLTPSFSGAAVVQDDGTMPTGLTIAGQTPPVWGGAAQITVNSLTDMAIATATLNMNNGTGPRESANSSADWGKGFVGGWHEPGIPTLTLDPEATVKTNVDWADLMNDGTLIDVTIVTGADSGNKLTSVINDCQVIAIPGDETRGKKLVDAVTLNVLGSIVHTFTLSA